MVNGLETATSGKVLVDGVDVGALSEEGLRGRAAQVGMIFQHFNSCPRAPPSTTALPLEIAGVDKKTIRAKVGPLLDLVGLGDKAGNYPRAVRRPEQRVGIARALATDPKLLLDEATLGARSGDDAVDPRAPRSSINAELGLTVLLITYRRDGSGKTTSPVMWRHRCRPHRRGRPDLRMDVYTNPKHQTTRIARLGAEAAGMAAFKIKAQPSAGDRALVRRKPSARLPSSP